MLVEIAGFIGGKLIDKIFDNTLDGVIDKFAKEKIKNEYKKIKKGIYNTLISENKEEAYFESLQRLLDESEIINVLFNFSYLITNLSMGDRRNYIEEYIEEFYNGKGIENIELSIIKGKIKQQFEYCFNVMNEPSDESRKLINQIVVKIANTSEYQTELMNYLKCDIEELHTEILNIEKLFPVSDVDLVYLRSMVKTSIDNLQVRFNREFNVDVELLNWLGKFCIIEDEKRNLYSLLKEVQDAISRINVNGKTKMIKKWNSLIEDLLENREFNSSLLEKDMEEYIDQVEEENKKKCSESENDYYKSNEYYDWRNLCVKNSNLDNYRKAFYADTLVITGEAGIGKSHSIAHFIYNYFYLQNKICIFVLGQHLNEQLDPVLMLEKWLHIPYTIQRFLEQLNRIAEENNCIIPFIIEGINEGYHSEVWKEYFEGLVGIFEKHNRIKLMVSIRKTYIKKCLPEKFQERDKTLVIEHRGFAEDSTQAVTEFFDYYGINKPTFPILYSDFYNPLFLHTLCKTVKGSGNVKIDEYSSFTEIFKGYITVIEESVSERCQYHIGLKLVKKCVDKIIQYSLKNNVRYGITIDKFYEIVGEVTQRFGVSLTEFVQAMIDNGLFYTELYGFDLEEEYIQFAYERYHNILAAQFLISDINAKRELVESISGGELAKYFINMHSGIVEELFVLVPEKYSVELLELLEEEKAEKVLDSFLNSLVWRKKTAISLETTIRMINKYIVVRPWYFKKLIEKLLIIAPIEGHPLNSLFLHKYLIKYTMAIRDSFWIECLYDDTLYHNGVLNTLVKLLINQLKDYTSETKELIAILLVWSLASTSNIHRENAIRSLVALMQDDFQIATETIKKFIQIDDGYVKEGLYCSIYGAVLRSQRMSGAEELAEMVFNDIFGRNEVYPHIIVRAHAKGIIDYLKQSNIKCGFDITKTVPPYNSKWYEKIPSQQEIDSYLFDYKDKEIKPYMYSVNTIIHSMATNTGEKSLGYGDFGRYVFEGWVEPWAYHFIAQDLSNIVTNQIFETYKYDFNLHGKFDNRVESYDRHKHRNERIGKKYQRIASFQMLSRLADNFSPGEVKREYSDAYQEWNSKRLEAIFDFDEYSDDVLDLLNEEYEEEDGVKEVFVQYKYEGPWQFYYRGIDPSVLAQKPSEGKNLWQDVFRIPDVSNKVWASAESEEPTMDKIVFVEYGNESFVALEMYNTWKSDCSRYDEEPKEYFAKAVAMLVPNDMLMPAEGKSKLKKYAEGRNNYEIYTVFAREYFWSEAYKDFEGQIERDYDEEDKDGYIETGIDYHCPMSYSEEVENVISSYAMPSKYLVENLELRQLDDGKWYDKSGKLVCLDIQFDGYHGALIIRKDSLFELINDQKLTVAWGIYTERKGNPHFYATRKIAKWDENEFSVEEYDTEQWTARF
ncbi:hypothetical protein CBB2_0734 [Clostridium botulinum]|uniref:hypothetical protein n=2 Tax=Clostridium botulinum TaxID=1491 RepID=UPI000581BC2A|nr:hypothetical protein [Clostridium botulinum]KEI88734.1 hypothetical protein N493_04170 [Clostridium botulinum B2 433]BAQ12844.1 hypothetical protein CBB2_0734 [Clostridium botulinum]